jgi:hypothetical protein
MDVRKSTTRGQNVTSSNTQNATVVAGFDATIHVVDSSPVIRCASLLLADSMPHLQRTIGFRFLSWPPNGGAKSAPEVLVH